MKVGRDDEPLCTLEGVEPVLLRGRAQTVLTPPWSREFCPGSALPTWSLQGHQGRHINGLIAESMANKDR